MKKLLLLAVLFLLSVSVPVSSAYAKSSHKHSPNLPKKSKKKYACKKNTDGKNSGTWVCKGGSCGRS